MSLTFLGNTLSTTGTILVSYMAIAVHYRVRKEHKIDETVFKHMKREQIVGFVGIVLILIGYLLEVPSQF